MVDVLQKIGWAAGDVYRHAHRLTIERDDPQGSAVLDEEEEDKNTTIVDEDERLDDADLDDQPIRGRRTDKSAEAYDKLKSERDRLRADSDKKDRLLQDLSTRLTRIEQGSTTRETRDDANRRASEEQEQIKARARALAGKVKDSVQGVDRNDPTYTEKVYEAIEAHNAELRRQDQERLLAEIDRRSSATVSQTLSDREVRERAEQIALDELKAQGLGEEHFELLEGLAAVKARKDPGWFKRIPDEDQIPQLVTALKEQVMKAKRSSQAFKDEKTRHRDDMNGVIGESSTTRRGSRQEDDDEGTEGPGSILADLSRMRKGQRQDSRVMLRSGAR